MKIDSTGNRGDDPAKQRAGGGDSGVSKRRRGIGDFEKTEGGRHVH